MGRGVVGELTLPAVVPRRPARICTRKSLAAPGLLGRKRVLVPPLVPMSLRVSKYWVRRTSAMTSSAVAPGTGLAEVLDGGAEAVDDGLTLGGDALALKGLGLGFGFGLFDFEDLVGFAAGLCCDLRAPGGVNVVHRSFDFDVGDDVGDERVENVETDC